MNTITKIENALKAINQASFQTLINHLLHLQGNKFVNAPGSVVGKEKTSKGTPDSSFLLNDDKYVFVECTTQERLGASKTFFEKLSKDIDHCFKEEITSIKKDKIEKIILACNEKISVKEHNKLKEKVISISPETDLEILNIQNLPMLILDIPLLAEEHLNIQMIKGEIYTLAKFLSKTEKGLQPKLTNEFLGREKELNECIESLNKYDILLLSGASGVGKTKLAVKVLEEFSKEDYIPIVIQSSGVSLWDDYMHLFTPGKNHIILFDDANNAVTNLNYLLSRLEDNNTFSAKLIITSRDYVKKQIVASLENYRYQEFNIPEFKDEEIDKIIVSVEPNLRKHIEIKNKIVELAKGNARISLMATYSVTEGSEINYLNSPELLYEKYFKKISEEIGIFQDSAILKSLAIVSFFGILDKENEELENLISLNFGINWNDLWSAIIELHKNEIVNIHSNQIVKVSDQVLATYAFYKCFIDVKSAVIDYAEWISIFIEKFSDRIRATLIDVNNTFTYAQVRDLVQPHLDKVLQKLDNEEIEYAFYSLFWFYKDRNCLLYVKKWLEELPQESHPDKLTFKYENNAHTKATKYFELLKNFWNHPNELLKPSLQLTLSLLKKQPARLPEILKHLKDNFSFKLEDRSKGYDRQNMLLDVLFLEEANDFDKLLKNGIFLHIAKDWLGWHYTELKPSKGHAFTIYNFDLYKCNKLINFRTRILNQMYNLFDPKNEAVSDILKKIIRPGGNIDKSIYIKELPIYEKFATHKLDKSQYEHCHFISNLAKSISEAGGAYPENWKEYLESDIIKLDKFLSPSWLYKREQSHRDSQDEKRKEFDEFVKNNNWKNLEKFLINANDLYNQQIHNKGWHIGSALTDIFISIARKDKSELLNALRLFFGGKVVFPLQVNLISIVLQENILTGRVLVNLMDEFEFKGKPYWQTVLLTNLPEEQIDINFLRLLLDNFKNSDEIYNLRMLDYLKYNNVFLNYQQKNSDLAGHNIISYLTTIIVNKSVISNYSFGFNFCEECGPYLTNHINLLKKVFWLQYEMDHHFDFEGNELKAIMDLDKNFINESLANGTIGLGYYSKIKLENINTDIIWQYPDYESLIEDILLTIIRVDKFALSNEKDIDSLFAIRGSDTSIAEKAKELIFKLTKKYPHNQQLSLLLVEIVYRNFRDWFVDYFKEFLTLNKDFSITRKISFDRTSSTTGSWVPVYQRKIEFYQSIINMINTLPDILDYCEHLDYFEQKIFWKKEEIEREQRRDFISEFY